MGQKEQARCVHFSLEAIEIKEDRSHLDPPFFSKSSIYVFSVFTPSYFYTESIQVH